MKYSILIGIIFLLLSCDNGNLSKSKAKDLINQCETNPYATGTFSFQEGNMTFSKRKEKMKEQYFSLQEQGLIKITDKGNKYFVEFTEDGKAYQSGKKAKKSEKEQLMEAMFGESQKTVSIISSNYKVKTVHEIREIPEMNGAIVDVTFELDKTTPFAILLNNAPKKEINKQLEFRKTTDGWKYCKSF